MPPRHSGRAIRAAPAVLCSFAVLRGRVIAGAGLAWAAVGDLRRQLGRAGEAAAERHLAALGFRVVERNFRTRAGELDLVCFDGATLVFCEVKARRGPAACPWDALGEAKRRKVRTMAAIWLAQRPDRPRAANLRFDAIGVLFDARGGLLRLDHLEGAF